MLKTTLVKSNSSKNNIYKYFKVSANQKLSILLDFFVGNVIQSLKLVNRLNFGSLQSTQVFSKKLVAISAPIHDICDHEINDT